MARIIKKQSKGIYSNNLKKMKSLYFWKGFNSFNWYILGLGVALGYVLGKI